MSLVSRRRRLRPGVKPGKLILGVGALVLTTVLTRALNDQSLTDNRQSVTQLVDGVLRPSLVRDGRLQVGPHVSALLLQQLREDRDLVTIKVWRPDGVLAWTNRAPERIGKHFDEEGDLESALHGHTAGSIGHLSEDENAVERSLGFSNLLQVYAPIRGRNGKVLGAYEIYADPKSLQQTLASRKHLLWGATALVFLALWTALAVLVRGASTTLRRQTRELRERSRALMDSYARQRLRHPILRPSSWRRSSPSPPGARLSSASSCRSCARAEPPTRVAAWTTSGNGCSSTRPRRSTPRSGSSGSATRSPRTSATWPA